MAQTPFQWLQDLERRARQRGAPLPRPDSVQQIWRGIAFRLGEIPLVTSLSDIREVLHCPTVLARVPGAKSWIKGLVNIRGLLLPVIDLSACLESKPIMPSNLTRLLIINQGGFSAGLMVDEVLGIKHFPEQLRDTESPCRESWLAPFAKGLFTNEENTWIVFDMHALVESESFLKAAI